MTRPVLPNLTSDQITKLPIPSKHRSVISHEFCGKVWGVFQRSLTLGEYGNLWLRLHDNSEFFELMLEGGHKSLRYLFPAFAQRAKELGYDLKKIEATKATEMAAS